MKMSKFKLKWWGWKSDRQTGSFPLPRIIWNLAWYIPLQVTRFLFCVCTLCAFGGSSFRDQWRNSL